MKRSNNAGTYDDSIPPLDRIRSIRDQLDLLALQVGDPSEAPLLADNRQMLRASAKELLRQRNIIAAHLGANDFVDPATNLMLFVYGGDTGDSKATLSAGACCKAAGVPRTTGLRWIGILEGRGLISSTVDPRDKRKTTLKISDNGRSIMDRCLIDISMV
ncbi:hypothetical protein [Sphingomonas sp. PP-CE-1G-424]|uniref:hypothetical protein n=1 Tax=Sphingomonas sp. PP-CE-1G-424 TaxID=2135658 RepID=UPI001055566C|nr:hypothetical protein [Sphingomonas sp. PP-CE-1G-424]